MPDTAATPLTLEQQEELENLLHKASRENRILCSSALAIAKSLGIPSGEVRSAANKLKLKSANASPVVFKCFSVHGVVHEIFAWASIITVKG